MKEDRVSGLGRYAGTFSGHKPSMAIPISELRRIALTILLTLCASIDPLGSTTFYRKSSYSTKSAKGRLAKRIDGYFRKPDGINFEDPS